MLMHGHVIADWTGANRAWIRIDVSACRSYSGIPQQYVLRLGAPHSGKKEMSGPACGIHLTLLWILHRFMFRGQGFNTHEENRRSQKLL